MRGLRNPRPPKALGSKVEGAGCSRPFPSMWVGGVASCVEGMEGYVTLLLGLRFQGLGFLDVFQDVVGS